MNTSQSSSTPRSSQNKKRAVLLIALFLLCLCAFALAISVGAADINVFDALSALIGGKHDDTSST